MSLSKLSDQQLEIALANARQNGTKDPATGFSGEELYAEQLRRRAAKGEKLSDDDHALAFPIRHKLELFVEFLKTPVGLVTLAGLGYVAFKTYEQRYGRRPMLAGLRGYNQKGYKFYLVSKQTGKIVSGWDYREDAKDAMRDEPVPTKIVTGTALRRSGKSPSDDSSWGSF